MSEISYDGNDNHTLEKDKKDVKFSFDGEDNERASKHALVHGFLSMADVKRNYQRWFSS